ncbi:Ssd1p/F48E8.6-like RNAseII [Cryptosporidium meleagridis]
MAKQNGSLCSIPQNKVKSSIYKGVIRVANPLESFVTVDDQVNGTFDIYIFGKKDIKDAIHGDIVLVKVSETFQGRLTRRFKEKTNKKLLKGNEEEQKYVINASNSKEFSDQFEHFNSFEDSNSIDNCKKDRLDGSQKSKCTTNLNQGLNKENINTENRPELLVESSSQSKHPTPKYVGAVIKVVESVTKKSPIVGFIRPLSFLERLEKEARMKKNSKKSRKKSLFKSTEGLNIQNCLKVIGINDNEAKLRTLEFSNCVDIKKDKLCFVPIKRVYPIMRFDLNRNTKEFFIKNNIIQNYKIPCDLLFGASIKKCPKGVNKKLQISKFYGCFNQFETIFSSLLDCYDLGSHKEIYDKYQSSPINVSKSSQEWKKQNNRREFDPKEYKIFTIDPPTAKDLDDAIHIKYDNELLIYEVGVHIADVYYYMLRHKELLSSTTKELCTSVYLPHTNFPMLPRVFSSNLCSLLPNQKRPTLSVIIKVNQEGEVIGEPEFVHGIITSAGKFSYDDIDQLFEIVDQIDKKNEKSKLGTLNYCKDSRISQIMKRSKVMENNRRNIVHDLLLLRTLTSIIRNSKDRSESIKLFNVDPCFNFKSEFPTNMTEPFNVVKNNDSFSFTKYSSIIPNIELKFDILSPEPNSLKKISPKRITVCYNHSISHSLIEELMLLANRVTAEFTVKNRPESSCIIRIHDAIANTKLHHLITYLRANGLKHIFEDNINRENIVNGLYKLYKDHGPLYYCTVSEMLRDIFSRARYIVYNKDARDSNILTNHFALNMNLYTHFTSPIRRAADILVHQMVYDILDNLERKPDKKSKQNAKNSNGQLVFSENDHAIICDSSNIKSNANKNMQRDSNNIFFSQLISRIHVTIPSIACIYKINASKLNVHLVLLYPTDFHQLFLISSDSFDKNSSLASLLKLNPSLPVTIKSKDNKIELYWKFNQYRLKDTLKKLKTSKKMNISSYLNMINDRMNNHFQHKLTFDQENKLILQIIGIWSYLPVILIPTTTLPPKFIVVPMNPLCHYFYEQISNFN